MDATKTPVTFSWPLYIHPSIGVSDTMLQTRYWLNCGRWVTMPRSILCRKQSKSAFLLHLLQTVCMLVLETTRDRRTFSDRGTSGLMEPGATKRIPTIFVFMRIKALRDDWWRHDESEFPLLGENLR
mmetsp:Transcript_17725/g.25553  ORF Transcript_17725/g.25553 Transcript_17725/m.25553 type:complete len:127 (+) Transcript_17725:3575-3955(+)